MDPANYSFLYHPAYLASFPDNPYLNSGAVSSGPSRGASCHPTIRVPRLGHNFWFTDLTPSLTSVLVPFPGSPPPRVLPTSRDPEAGLQDLQKQPRSRHTGSDLQLLKNNRCITVGADISKRRAGNPPVTVIGLHFLRSLTLCYAQACALLVALPASGGTGEAFSSDAYHHRPPTFRAASAYSV